MPAQLRGRNVGANPKRHPITGYGVIRVEINRHTESPPLILAVLRSSVFLLHETANLLFTTFVPTFRWHTILVENLTIWILFCYHQRTNMTVNSRRFDFSLFGATILWARFPKLLPLLPVLHLRATPTTTKPVHTSSFDAEVELLGLRIKRKVFDQGYFVKPDQKLLPESS